MKLNYRIKAPDDPIDVNFKMPECKIPLNGYYIYGKDMISHQVKSYFKDQLGLEITVTVLFPRPKMRDMPHRQNQGVIHHDITWNNNRFEPVYYAVNYEITDSITNLTWWETTDPPLYPPEPLVPTVLDQLRGVHYKKRNNFDSLENYKPLDSIKITMNNPVLVNTVVPHSVDYAGQNHDRWGLSIRFDRAVNNWDEAVDIFKKIIIE